MSLLVKNDKRLVLKQFYTMEHSLLGFLHTISLSMEEDQ